MLQRYKITAIYTSKQLAIRMLNKYKNLPTTHDLQSRTLLLLGFSIRYLFIFNLLSLQLLIFLFRLNNQSQNYIYILLANLQILL